MRDDDAKALLAFHGCMMTQIEIALLVTHCTMIGTASRPDHSLCKYEARFIGYRVWKVRKLYPVLQLKNSEEALLVAR